MGQRTSELGPSLCMKVLSILRREIYLPRFPCAGLNLEALVT
jgi:hypothetical protein